MDAVFFSIMRCCSVPNLFTLSRLCTETRSIFISKAFWKARFAFLGIKHEQPCLQVYLRCLRIDRELLSSDWAKFVFYHELDLQRLAELDKSEAQEFRETSEKKDRLHSELQEAQDVGDFDTYFYCFRELQALINQYLIIQKKRDKYDIFKQREKYDDVGHEITKIPLLEGVCKREALNLLLRLHKDS